MGRSANERYFFLPDSARKCFFDVGAEYGLASCAIHSLAQAEGYEIKRHLFEALPENAFCIQKTIETFQLPFNLVEGVITDHPGVSFLQLPTDSSVGMVASGQGGTGGVGVQVKNIILSEYLESQNISGPIFMKIDIEGCEYQALSGAKDACQFLGQRSGL